MKVVVRKKKNNNYRPLTYSDMENIYYEILDHNYCESSNNEVPRLRVCGLTGENAIVINLGKMIIDIFPAVFVWENNKYVQRACLEAASFCIVAGDMICGQEINPFRKKNFGQENTLSDLADYLYEICRVQANSLMLL